MSSWRGSIKGLQAAQAAVLRGVAALKPDGAFGDAIRFVTVTAHRYLASITVVATGSWRASHRPEVRGLTGRIFMDPAARNPKGGAPAVYGAELELTRGGRYAIYRKTAEDAGPAIAQEAGERLRRALP